MQRRFNKHYSREEAQSLLPQARLWLGQLREARAQLLRADERLAGLLATGHDIGGEVANQWVRTLADFRRLLREFEGRQIQVKDLDRGLLDFPAMIGGREVFLCWEEGEEEIEYWHDLESGFAGRERLE